MASGHIFMEGFGQGTWGRTHYLRQNRLETSFDFPSAFRFRVNPGI